MGVLITFVTQAVVCWVLSNSTVNLAKERAEESQHEMYAEEMQRIIQSPKIDEEALKAKYKLMLNEYDRVQYPIAMASVFMLLAIVFTVLSIVAALIVFL